MKASLLGGFLLYGMATIFIMMMGFTSHLQGVQALNGTISVHPFESAILGFQRHIEVYLPKGYNHNDTTQYPVVYFLHGFLGNHTAFPYIHQVVDDMIYGQQSMSPMIIIKPNGAINGTTVGSLWANSILNGRFEDYFFQEVIPWAENEFKIFNDSRKRMIMGHSFGASAAMRFAFQHPELFGSIACHSGFVKMDSWLVSFYVNQSVVNDFKNGVVSPAADKIFTLFVFTGAKAWSPNLSQPHSVDLPMYNNGSAILREDIVAKWESYSPHTIMAQNKDRLKANPPKVFYFDIGAQDELLLLKPNLEFASLVVANGFNYYMRIYDGYHNNETQLRLRFRDSIGAFDNYLLTISEVDSSNTNTIETSPSDASQNEDSDSDGPFPYGLVIGVIVGVLAAAIIAIVLTYLIVTSKFHILFLEKKLTNDDDLE